MIKKITLLLLVLTLAYCTHQKRSDSVNNLAVSKIKSLGNSEIKGKVYFKETKKGLMIDAQIRGLNPNQKHGFHIHEFGDCSSNDGKSAGGHYDPEHHKNHGEPHQMKTHAGDLGNLEADPNGIAVYRKTFSNLTLNQKNAILNRAIIIHAKEDQFVNPAGNAGSRIGCGVIKKSD
jgi:Cu-Zn family superoxide dismutase